MCRISIMTDWLIGCWRFTGMLTQNGVVTVGNNETTPLRPDSSQRIHEGQRESDKREFCSTCSFLKRHGPPVLGNYVLGQVKKKLIVSRPDFLKKGRGRLLLFTI